MDEKTFEMFACAQINFDNVEKMVPSIKMHPIYMIARKQLDEAINLIKPESYKDMEQGE